MSQSSVQTLLDIHIHSDIVDFEIIDTQEAPAFQRLLIKYLGSENDQITAYVFIPKIHKIIGGVLVHHQHNGERHLGKSEVAGLTGDRFQFFCPELAKKGIVSMAPDSICFEDRRTNQKGIEPDANPDQDWLQHYNEMCYRLLNGTSLMKKVVEDSAIAISILAKLEGVDKNKIGILGHSYGGNTVIFHSPLDDRIKYACSSGAVCSYQTKFKNNTGIEMAEVIPNFTKEYDIDHLLKMIYPRKILVVSSDSDKYSKDASQIGLSLKEEMKVADFEQAYYFKEFPGGHKLNEERFNFIINWFVDRFNEQIKK